MAHTLQPNVLLSSLRNQGLELPISFPDADGKSLEELREDFTGQFERLTPLPEHIGPTPGYRGVKEHANTRMRTGEVCKVMTVGEVSLNLRKHNYFRDDALGSYSEFADWRHIRSNRMRLSLPLAEDSFATISIGAYSTSIAIAGGGKEDFDGIKDYEDYSNSPGENAGWKAIVKKIVVIEADFPSSLRAIGIGIEENVAPRRAETTLKLKAEGEFKGVDLERALVISTALLKTVQPEMLETLETVE